MMLTEGVWCQHPIHPKPQDLLLLLVLKKINTTAAIDSSTNQKDAKIGWRLLCFEELHISTQKTEHWHTY
jgi:hypothetical protein